MPGGKPAGVRCTHLDEEWRCGLFGDPRRPVCCSDFQAEPDFCGNDREEAIIILGRLEELSRP